MTAELYERASHWTPAWLKEFVRTGATRVACRIGTLPSVELLGAHLVTLFDELGINCVLDVGAHVGQYGRFLRNIGYTGRIVSFEPILANFTQLEQRCARDDKWTARRLALGDQDGFVPINVAHVTQFSSLLSPNRYSHDQFGELSDVNRIEMVEVRRLESVFEDCVRGAGDARVFLKLDTQGYDLKIVESAGVYLDQIRALQSEFSVKPIYEGMTGYLCAMSRLNQMGFELTGVFPVVRDEQLRIVELDGVLVRARDAGSR